MMRRPHTIPPVAVPQNDDGYFEAMTRAVFQMGIDWEIIRQRWPAFRTAFREFSVEEVAAFGPDEVDALLAPASGIVRNYRKIMATVHNAAAFQRIQAEHGSFWGYLRSLDGQPYAAVVKELRRRFHHLGDTGAFVFLHGVGEKVPAWLDRHVSGGGGGPKRARGRSERLAPGSEEDED